MSAEIDAALGDLEANLKRQADCIGRHDAVQLGVELAAAAEVVQRLKAAFSRAPAAVHPRAPRLEAAISLAQGLEQEAARVLGEMRGSITETARLRSGYRALGAAVRIRIEGGGLLNQRR